MITILSPHMGSNALGRALVLAELAQELGHEVRIVGTTRAGDAVWPPALSLPRPIPLHTIPLHRAPDYGRAARALRGLLREGEPLIISKPLPTSLGLALLAGVNPRGRGVLLDIDDWELGFRYKDGDPESLRGVPNVARAVWDSTYPSRLNTTAGVWACEQLVGLFPHRIVSNGWLEARFGGLVLPHVRDRERLSPSGADGARVREKLGMGDERAWFGFIGTPRVHKGVDLLIEAVARLEGAPGEEAPGVMLLGCDPNDRVGSALLEQGLKRLGEARLRWWGSFGFEELADHVAAADVVVIPSRKTMESVGQIPAKLFDAMAMAKPVIVSDVNDMAQIVAGCGEVVAPGSVEALEGGMRRMLSRTREEREAMGRAARARFEARYDFVSGSAQLQRALEAAGR